VFWLLVSSAFLHITGLIVRITISFYCSLAVCFGPFGFIHRLQVHGDPLVVIKHLSEVQGDYTKRPCTFSIYLSLSIYRVDVWNQSFLSVNMCKESKKLGD